ncbi:DUF7130 family rubredoxin-like protein [Halobaculum lipolyticum]|uniref:DUF7130 domain-containing protein n=1 Tax=Halobaculum lipolyticum TaxID=3032001 RepID=A0ABD5WHB9_9EURY|nr:hypothetical protein [Halobaculum sp. DT31]
MATEQHEEGPKLTDVSAGQSVYDAEGNELGTVRGVDDAGFYVLAAEGTGAVSLDEARDVLGKAYVMWRCWECGAMGRIEGQLPARCPDCDAPREDLYYWAED